MDGLAFCRFLVSHVRRCYESIDQMADGLQIDKTTTYDACPRAENPLQIQRNQNSSVLGATLNVDQKLTHRGPSVLNIYSVHDKDKPEKRCTSISTKPQWNSLFQIQFVISFGFSLSVLQTWNKATTSFTLMLQSVNQLLLKAAESCQPL